MSTTGITSASIEAEVVTLIRADVLRSTFAPSERLVEADLAERYGVPRAAVRNALVVLASEGLVLREPNVGARVRALTIEEAIELAETRQELESFSARLAATRATDEDRAAIEECLRRLQAATMTEDLSAYADASVDFHVAVGRAAHHGVIRRILAEVRNHRFDHHFPAAFAGGPARTSMPDHAEIGRAVLARDPEAAAAAMHRHVGSIVRRLRAWKAET